MLDIHEALRRKRAKYAQLSQQIELLQQAAAKLREVAPLLAEDADEDDAAVLPDLDEQPATKATAANAGAGTSTTVRATVPRWP
jgi:hypothetical protein